MKATIKTFGLFALSFLMLILSTSLYAQDKKYDKVIKMNGEEFNATVTDIQGNSITYVYPGETLKYTMPKNEVYKIVFVSGRTQVITQPSSVMAESDKPGYLPIDQNLVAVLPYNFLVNGEYNQEEGFAAQSFNYSFYLKKQGSFNKKLQPTETTNQLLINAGINSDNIRGYSITELARILGVGGIIKGTINVNLTQSSTKYTAIENKEHEYDKNKSTATKITSENATTTDEYKTVVDLTVFDGNTGEVIWNKNRISFSSQRDAYRATIKYLFKKTPYYNK